MLCRQRLNAFGLYKITKIRVKSQNTGEIRAILPKCPYIRAGSYKYGRLLHTGIDLI